MSKLTNALLDTLIDVEFYYNLANLDNPNMPSFKKAYRENIRPLEKATGKTYAELKEAV